MFEVKVRGRNIILVSDLTPPHKLVWYTPHPQHKVIKCKAIVEKIWQPWNESSQISLSPSNSIGNIWERKKSTSLYENINDHKTFLLCEYETDNFFPKEAKSYTLIIVHRDMLVDVQNLVQGYMASSLGYYLITCSLFILYY